MTVILLLALSADPKPGTFASEKVEAGGATRHYRLVVPKAADPAKPAPLVVAFHGMLIDSKDVMPAYTKLSDTAQKHGFLLAYPDAVGGSWGIDPKKVKADLLFFDALLEKLRGEYRIDPDRVYVVGMSNGGYFAHLVGKERSKTVAAVASHSGPLGLQTLLGVRAERKFPVLIVHGDRDKLFPVEFARENRDKLQARGARGEVRRGRGAEPLLGGQGRRERDDLGVLQGSPAEEGGPVMRAVVEWWGGLPWWLRLGVALLFLLASTVLWFGFDRFWPWGWVVGVVLLLFSFPNDAERRGYHDF